MSHEKIIYEPHPVHPARKAKLQADGYKILDAIFAPAGTPIHVKLEEEAEVLEVVEVSEEAEVFEAVEVSEETEVADKEEAEDAPAKRGRPKKG